MLIDAFRALWRQLIVIAFLAAIGIGLAWIVDGRDAAIKMIEIGVVQMKGPWVWTFGYGLAEFVGRRGRTIPLDLNGVFEPHEIVARAVARIHNSTLHRKALLHTLPITALGIFLTAMYGIPLSGISLFFVFVLVSSIYYIGAFLLFHFVEFTLAFDQLLEGGNVVQFRRVYSPIHFENMTSYLALTTALGLIGIYAGFRGTVTTDFQFHNEMWKTFLIVPLILFLPGTLFYNYYPRYVLRKILQHKVFETMQRLGTADDVSARSLVLDLKETVALNSQILPFLDYKSLPAYLLAISFGLSVAYNSDPAVRQFVQFFIHLGTR